MEALKGHDYVHLVFLRSQLIFIFSLYCGYGIIHYL